MLRIIVEELSQLFSLILTECGLWVRKSRISRGGVVMPKSRVLKMSLDGIVVLKVELWLKNKSLTLESCCQGVHEMASVVYLLQR